MHFFGSSSLIIIALSVAPVAACPLIGGLVDYNCDERIKIVVTGDSIVAGVGDTRNGNRGGYVLRLEEYFPDAIISEVGVPGTTAGRLFSQYRRNIGRPRLIKLIRRADLVIMDLGRNAYWTHHSVPKVMRNLKRLARFLSVEIEKLGNSAPKIFLGSQLPTTRGFETGFIGELNQGISLLRSKYFKKGPRFDRMPTSVIGPDGLHPTSQGYNRIAKMTAKFIRGQAQKVMKHDRKDRDLDGIYDMFEESLFGTSPLLADSDGDGVSDGEEIFVLHTDPLAGS